MTGKKVAISYAASNNLIKQIEQGAPADIFFSADTDWMDYGQQKGLIKPDTRTEAANRDRCALVFHGRKRRACARSEEQLQAVKHVASFDKTGDCHAFSSDVDVASGLRGDRRLGGRAKPARPGG